MSETEKLRIALNEALDMLYAISIGRTFAHSLFMGKVSQLEQMLNPELPHEAAGYVSFAHRPQTDVLQSPRDEPAMIDPRNCTYTTEAKARGTAAQCNQDDADGWTYTAKPAGATDQTPVDNPTHQQWWYVEVRDETGHLLGNL